MPLGTRQPCASGSAASDAVSAFFHCVLYKRDAHKRMYNGGAVQSSGEYVTVPCIKRINMDRMGWFGLDTLAGSIVIVVVHCLAQMPLMRGRCS